MSTLPLGDPLAGILDKTPVQGSFEFINHLLQRSNNPTVAQQYATLSDADTFALFAESVIEHLADRPDLHERARAYVGAEEFRQQFSRDVMALVGMTLVQDSRIAASRDPALVAGWEQFGITPREDLHTDEARAQAGAELLASLQASIGALSVAYLEHTVAAIVRGEVRQTPRTSPLPALGFDPDTISFVNSPHALAFMRGSWAIANGDLDKWQRPEEAPPFFEDKKNGVYVYVQESADYSPQALDQAWQRVLALDDNKVSTFLICLGKWLADSRGDMHTRGKTPIHVGDILSFRCIKKHHKGGYRREHKEEARRDVWALNSVFVRSREIQKHGGKEIAVNIDSRLLEVTFESVTDASGKEEPFAFRIAPGDWAIHYLNEHRYWVAQLLRPVMGYDPYTQRLAMRLGIFLAIHWRIRAQHQQYEQPWPIDTLIEGAILPVPRHASSRPRFRDQFEAALDQLQSDGVIAAWEYAGDGELPDRGWWERWREWKVRIVPPTLTVEQYAPIAPARTKAIVRSKRAGAARRARLPVTPPPPCA